MSLAALITRERERFAESHPKSAMASLAAEKHWPAGVPLHWMRDWPVPFPPVIAEGHGATVTDIDGHVYEDFCLGDTPALFGHGHPAVARAISRQIARGATFMLPTADTAVVGALLAQRFGLPFWQMTNTATEANRSAIRWARAITGKDKILLFDGCYHGALDDAFVRLGEDGTVQHRPGLIGQVQDLTAHARVVPFNDVAALEAALAHGDVAAVLAEPAMTNVGMILPDAGFHEALRQLSRAAGALLILDETHTISTGPGGAARAWGLEPDMLVIGKPIAGGIPAAVLGMSASVAAALDDARARAGPGYSGIGTTLSGNALAMAAMRAMLEEVMTDEAYAHMDQLGAQLEAGLTQALADAGVPWSVVRIGSRLELVFSPKPPKTGAAMRTLIVGPRHTALHLWLINRGLLIAPFHSMMLTSPFTSADQVEQLVDAASTFFAVYASLDE
jgi:glutamate-1-semialdehyde 2,1-aminomutase